jgi:hydrogenase maturation protein HypF
MERLHIALRGAVQGVGFRPTVYRIAERLRLSGWVRNSIAGLEIEVEGDFEQLDHFLLLLKEERPSAAVITEEDISRIDATGSSCFEILSSDAHRPGNSPTVAAVLPDLATCAECVSEILDPADRRFGYAFTNCTRCGPRYTIVHDIPYDRSNTTLQDFQLCSLCRQEFDSPGDRRFHAQPTACAACGPHLWCIPEDDEGNDVITQAAKALGKGSIVALKGVGGFQLLVDARNGNAVKQLRERKHREKKPFAVMMPSVECVRRYCFLSEEEEEVLLSSTAPILLLQPRAVTDLAPEVAKSSAHLGVMLPYSPLHHLLMACWPFPVVATSGNRAAEPIAFDNEEAVTRLKEMADCFILHDRPIARPCDDSVVRMSQNGPQIIRRARGYAPLPIIVPKDLPPILAVGGHLKSTIAIAVGRQVFLSQHLGDLDSVEARYGFERAIEDLCRLYRFQPKLVSCDLHPDYASTQWALNSGLPIIQIQHHHAHVAACAAENGIESNYLGVAWDGSGLGIDKTIWGGEFLLASANGMERVAHLRPFRLPGGEAAIRDCSRPAASLMWEAYGSSATKQIASPNICAILDQKINAPLTTSVGRMFDAVAYLSGIGARNQFEGQAAMALEHAIGQIRSDESYAIETNSGVGDWAPLLEALLADTRLNLDASQIAVKFHNALANWIVAVAQITDVRDVVLSGGVFQNAYLSTRVSVLLEQQGFRVFTHHQVPPNDGGLSLGQTVLAGQFAL